MQPYHRHSSKFVAPAILTTVHALLALPVGFVSHLALSHLSFPLYVPSILIVFFNGSGATGKRALRGPHSVLVTDLVE